MSLEIREEYQAMLASEAVPHADRMKHDRKGQVDNQREPRIQGALILQSLLRLNEPHCSIVADRFARLNDIYLWDLILS